MKASVSVLIALFALLNSLKTVPALDISDIVHIANFGPQPCYQSFWRKKGSNAIALDFAHQKFQLTKNEYIVKDNYRGSDTGLTHIYLQQTIDNIEVINGRINININDEGHIVAYSNSIYKPKYGQSGTWREPGKPFISAKDALKIFADRIKKPIDISKVTETAEPSSDNNKVVLNNVPFARNNAIATRRYLRLNNGTTAPVWNIQMATFSNYFDMLDWTANAKYRVVPIGNNNPADTPRQLLTNPEDFKTSPSGWIDTNYNKTPDGGYKLICNPIPGSQKETFDYPLDLTKNATEYSNASVTNLFYVVNSLHDFFYKYGFNEVAGNFQANNFGKGAVDGKSPELHLYRYNTTNPTRDAAFDNAVVAHEYTHGVTDRLVGGPSGGGCMALLGPSGISEGSSDFYSYATTSRTYPYSTDMQVNPTTYGLFNDNKWTEPHKLGEIWATVLYEMHWNLVDKLGFDSNIRSANLNRGNTLSMQLFISSLKLMKCQPSYIDARDAILQAEKTLTKGAHSCALWKAFAKRGLGIGAALNGTRTVVVVDTDILTFIDNVVENFDVPNQCRQ
ncbi:Fungalysin metallopeptidase-domain-containing protein [Syncephalis fuscata]|nr:Fungalysin metallopeptidase-domain-containing protein [Syncephalis fuscata]